MLWAIYCTGKANTAALREQHMRPHREYLDQRRSVLVLGGATLTDDGATASGSLFIINVETRADAAARHALQSASRQHSTSLHYATSAAVFQFRRCLPISKGGRV
jgi:uncharacterized protein YciI